MHQNLNTYPEWVKHTVAGRSVSILCCPREWNQCGTNDS